MRRLLPVVLLLAGCAPDAPPAASGRTSPGARPGVAQEAAPLEPPPPAPAKWRPIIGEYASGGDTASVLEDGGLLELLVWQGPRWRLQAVTDTSFEALAQAGAGGLLTTRHDAAGHVAAIVLTGGDKGTPTRADVESFPSRPRVLPRLHLGADEGDVFRITPLRPPAELRAEALAAAPPAEEGDFLPADLVELTSLDPSIRLDIRYATTNNFMGQIFYASARAFLQRPAAEALVRAHRWLKTRGYGLLIHDGYRPWYVTKMFWDATPEPLRVFVADPARGSRHNRGCAVDLTLYSLATGKAVTMPGGYDEMSPRSYPGYPGGTSRQRWFRALLRRAMEAQGFTVYAAEWWHFDYKDWKRYRISNERFEDLPGG